MRQRILKCIKLVSSVVEKLHKQWPRDSSQAVCFFIQLKHGCCTILYHDCKPSVYMVNLLKTSREKWLSCYGYMKSIYWSSLIGFFSVLFLSISSKGLTNAERITASCHPADQISIDAFKVLIFNSNYFFFQWTRVNFLIFFPEIILRLSGDWSKNYYKKRTSRRSIGCCVCIS